MCLDLKITATKRTAKKDITCYKYLVLKNENGVSYLQTPYRDCIVSIGEIYQSKLEINYYWNCGPTKELNQGLHSFVNLEDARSSHPEYYYEKGENSVIYVKCIIPKGTKYYLGQFDGFPSMASEKLIYLEIIK